VVADLSRCRGHAQLHLKEAIESVGERAVLEAEKLRDSGLSDWRAGRRHAYFAMLALNARLCRKRIG
jgi:hypothetical protein